MRLLALVALLGGLCLAAPAPAAAEEDPLTRKKVQTYLDLAADLFKAADYEGALVELRRAEALSDLAVVRFNIARCLEQLQRDGEAIAAFERYLALNDSIEGGADRQKRARDAVTRLSAGAATLGVLEVQCPNTGSTVVIAPIVPAPVACPWRSDRVPAGIYDVQTMTPGMPPIVTRAQVAAGLSTVVVAGGPTTAVTPPGPRVPDAALRGAPIMVRFSPAREGDEFQVNVDGATCKTPCELAVTPGRHQVEVTGATSYSATVDFPTSGPVEAKLGRRRGAFLGVGIGSVCTGGVVALVGLGWIASSSTAGEVAEGAVILLSGAAVAVAGGIVGFKLAGSNKVRFEAPEKRAFAPQLIGLGLAPTRGGAVAGATFQF